MEVPFTDITPSAHTSRARTYGISALLVLVLLCGVSLSVLLGKLELQHKQEQERLATLSELAAWTATLEGTVATTLSGMSSIAQVLKHTGTLSVAQFDGLAAEAMSYAPAIRSIAVVRQGVIMQIAPFSGNESMIGFDLRTRADQFRTFAQAEQQRQPLLSGPMAMVQGAAAFLYHIPVYLKGPDMGSLLF